jgi:hypothetical protein
MPPRWIELLKPTQNFIGWAGDRASVLSLVSSIARTSSTGKMVGVPADYDAS